MLKPPERVPLLGTGIHPTHYDEATRLIIHWAKEGGFRMVCAANVHMVMEAHDDPRFKAVLNQADLVTPDGMPLVWHLKRRGIPSASRVYGPTLTLHVCEAAAREKIPVALYGASEDTSEKFAKKLRDLYPELSIVERIVPPFRPLNKEEETEFQRRLLESGAKIVLVGLGCPKQEWWIEKQKGIVPLTFLAVGAAFDFHSGNKPQAPAWMQKIGMEWFFRLCSEPRRLAKRYIWHNGRYTLLFFCH